MIRTTPDSKISFERYMEIGRVALVNYGKDYGKLGVFVDVIDQNKATIGSPDMVRSQVNFKRWSPISRLKLAVPLLEIGLSVILEMSKEKIRKKIKVVVMRRILTGKVKSRKLLKFLKILETSFLKDLFTKAIGLAIHIFNNRAPSWKPNHSSSLRPRCHLLLAAQSYSVISTIAAPESAEHWY
ncbi:60S ribosomal protein L14-2-like [Hevea brasiliensis]|uniref:60S ribosomal protein L14-2-like n=1 Tax=Hevea brasiliensis TaxID=3981 RepID=UPI0025FFAD49|nr:60S ribosomal protein L14-2-like [Hevea brasiliensis]